MLDRREKKRMQRAVSRRWSQLRSADRLLYINVFIEIHFDEDSRHFPLSCPKSR